MKKYLVILLLLFALPAWSTTYYVRPAGHDANCNGTVDVDDSAGVRPNCAWATLGKSWTSADTSANNTINVAAGSYGAEIKNTSGGPSTGYTWTYQFSADATTVTVPVGVDYIFRPTSGRLGTTIFQGGYSGAPKTTKFQFASGYATAGGAVTFSNIANVYVFIDMELDATLANSNSAIMFYSQNGVSYYVIRTYLHGFQRAQSLTGGNYYIVSSLFHNNTPGITIGTDAYDNYLVNNTFLAYGVTANVINAGTVAKAGKVRILNNLYVTDTASRTNQYFRSAATAAGTWADYVEASNIAWKTSTMSWGASNAWVMNYDISSTRPDTLICVDPQYTGNTSTPSVATTSLTIGRGVDPGSMGARGVTAATDFANTAYPSFSVGCSAVSGGTKQYLTRANKTILIGGDSWVSNDAFSLGWAKPASKLLHELTDFKFFYLQGGNTPAVDLSSHIQSDHMSSNFYGLPGIAFYYYKGMYTQVAQWMAANAGGAPSVIFLKGGGNDMANIAACTSSTKPDSCCSGFRTGSCAGWGAAAIADMHIKTADALYDLYAAGDKPIIISMVASRDGLGDTDGSPYGSTYVSTAETAENTISAHYETAGYRMPKIIKHFKKVGATNLYTNGVAQCTAGDVDTVCTTAGHTEAECRNSVCGHPNQTGWDLAYELLKPAVLSEQYISEDSITKTFQAIKDSSNAAFAYQYGLTVAGDSCNVYHYTVSGFANDGILIQGASPTIKNTISSGNNTSAGAYKNVRQALTGATLTALTEDYNDFRGDLSVNGYDPGDAVHSVTGDPLFVSSSNFNLTSSSPGRDKGVDLCAILIDATDMAGNAVCTAGVFTGKGTAPDIGAYEYWITGPKIIAPPRGHKKGLMFLQ